MQGDAQPVWEYASGRGHTGLHRDGNSVLGQSGIILLHHYHKIPWQELRIGTLNIEELNILGVLTSPRIFHEIKRHIIHDAVFVIWNKQHNQCVYCVFENKNIYFIMIQFRFSILFNCYQCNEMLVKYKSYSMLMSLFYFETNSVTFDYSKIKLWKLFGFNTYIG